MRFLRFFFFIFFVPALCVADITKEIHFDIGDLTRSEQDGKIYINLKDSQREFRVGYPDLPIKLLTFIIPSDVEVDSLEVSSLSSDTLEEEYTISLVGADTKTDDNSAIEYQENDTLLYNPDLPYPQKLASILNCGYLSGNHLITLTVYPLQYFAAGKRLVFHNDLRIKLIFKPNQNNSNSFLMNKKVNQGILEELVFNKEDILSCSPAVSLSKQISIPASAQYIVITNQEMKDALVPLIEWKTKKGIKTEIVTVDSIYSYYAGMDFAEKIRNFLIEAYQRGLEWVLLAGNEDIVPVRYAYQSNASTPPSIANQQICDLYYSDLTGNWDQDGDGIWGEPLDDSPDIYPEIFVGRVPCQNAQEAGNFVEKVLNYERNPIEGGSDYLNRALWICSDQMRDWNEEEGQHKLISRYIPTNFYQELNNLIESPSGDAPDPVSPKGQNCIESMNQGWGIIGILAHGRIDGFVASSNLINEWPKSYVFSWPAEEDGHGHLTSLSNQGKYGIVYSISCNQGAIDYDKELTLGGGTSVAESFILSCQKGAVAFLGYSRWGWVSSSYKLGQAFMQELFDSTNDYHLGMAEALSKLYYPYYWDLNYGHNLFGDPEMQVWTQVPGSFSVSYTQTIETGSEDAEFQVSTNGNPVPQAKICITEGNEILFLAETDEQGKLSAQLDIDHCTELAVTITKTNFTPYQGTIKVSSTAGVGENQDPVPLSFELSQNYPNPFNPTTQINYQIPEDEYVSLEIYNVLGQKVKTLVNQNQTAGKHTIIWEGKDNQNNELPSGTYFYKLKSNNNRETRKMLLLK